MLVSLNEIKKYMSLDGFTVEQIANGLTFAGIEVEEISINSSVFQTQSPLKDYHNLEISFYIFLFTFFYFN